LDTVRERRAVERWLEGDMAAGDRSPDIDQKAARHKLASLHRLLAGMEGALVAFSGGADSAFLAFMAYQALGDRACAVTADSPSLARAELREAGGFARQFGLRHRVVATGELDDERYVRNSHDRCYFCKDALMRALQAISAATGAREILVGVNLDDLDDHRPGQRAVKQLGGRWPLVEVGLAKAEIRWLSRELGLPTWDKPAAACLSSRLAYGVPVTAEALRRVEQAEDDLRALGLGGQVRVRDQGGDLARIETDPDTLQAVLDNRPAIVTALRAAGFLYVTLDLEGYRQGSHNAVLLQVRPRTRS
jgi:pyridinium-3,5-biscarboxylic acid mononucleotide sulfurtransferase